LFALVLTFALYYCKIKELGAGVFTAAGSIKGIFSYQKQLC